jgi:tryptophan synthase alpha chain
MGYYNPILQAGLAPFARDAAAAGLDGLIIPDLPPEESGPLRSAMEAAAIDLVFLLAPTSGAERLRLVVERTRGFLYLVSLVGVTGARDELSPGLASWIATVRSTTRLPLAVGFGISTPSQAARVADLADGVIVGSALVQAMTEGHDPIAAAAAFVASLRAGMAGP